MEVNGPGEVDRWRDHLSGVEFVTINTCGTYGSLENNELVVGRRLAYS
jgi:hypothetical protein